MIRTNGITSQITNHHREEIRGRKPVKLRDVRVRLLIGQRPDDVNFLLELAVVRTEGFHDASQQVPGRVGPVNQELREVLRLRNINVHVNHLLKCLFRTQ